MSDPRRCGACGAAVVPGVAFCRACGARQEEDSCPGCGAPLVPGAAFCRGCGAPVAAASPEPPASPPPAPAEPPASPPPAPPAPVGAQGGLRRTPLLVAAAILLLGAGAAAAIVLSRGGDGGTTTVAEASAGARGEGEAAAGEAGEAEEALAAEAGELDADGLPRVSRGEMEGEIAAVLRGYHEDVVAGEFRAAWELLSSRKRQQYLAEYGYPKWRQAQASLSAYLSPAGLRARIDGIEGDGVVRVDVSGMGWSAPGSSCTEWSGLTWMRFEAGAWAYDPGYSTTPQRRRTWQPRAAELLGGGC